MIQYLKKFFVYFLMVTYLFMMCSSYVYAADHGGSGGTDHNPDFITDAGTINVEDDGVVMYYIEYILANIGAIFSDHDFLKVLANDLAMKEYISKGKYDPDNKTVTFPKETVVYVKERVDEYAKTEFTKEENGGFYLLPTTSISDVPASHFRNAQMFRTFRNIVIEKGCLGVATNYYYKLSFIDIFSDPDHPIMLVGNVSHLNAYKDNPERYVSCTFFCANEWLFHKGAIMQFPEDDQIYTSCSDAKHNINAGLKGYTDVSRMNPGEGDSGNFCFYSTTGEYIRVFVSQNAAKNYTVGNRKVYFTENYYNYVPEDLSVSIDDLQKTVDDLQKVIDELLKQIGNNTSEKEIMDLLKQILEELRNQQGGGNEGGGDVNIDIDLSTTNSWLSKIYAKVSQIFDKMSDGSDGTGGSILQKGLDSILVKLDELSGMLKKYLSEITGDLDDIKGQLENMTEQEFDEKSDSFLKDMVDMFSEIADVAKGKFPFSIPNDMRILLERIAITPSEPVALHTDDMSGVSVYSDDHGGGGSSRDDETEPPGGGGASRPGGSGFVSVEHGGGGSSGEPVEQKDGAPVFRLPIVIERYHIEEYIVIDMSPFEPVSRMSRSLFMIMYVICLYNLTFKVMGLWGDLVG